MAGVNLPLAFGALLAGAVVIDYGVKNTKSAFGSASSSSSGGGSAGGGGGSASPPATGAGAAFSPAGNGSLAKNASGALNSSQQAFASRLQADTGLDPAVIAGWLLSEEPASSSAAPNGANNWLNIGAFDSGNWAFGGSNVWSSPQSAADATASFMLGHPVNGVAPPEYGSAGIRGILSSVGQSVGAQIHAIQSSGWATSGYPNLASVVAEFQ